MTVINLSVEDVRAEAERELKQELRGDLKAKVKSKLLDIERAKKVLHNLEEELEVLLEDAK